MEIKRHMHALTFFPTKGINRLEQARNRVCSLVETLKSRFLLLEGDIKDHVRMHDVFRDVAVFIASHKKLITTHSNDVSWISPYIGGGIWLHAGSRVFPNLHLLWIYGTYNIDDGLFEEMKELNVLSIRHPQVPRIPKMTRLLENLQTLVLEYCHSLESITVVGELVNLKILVCSNCDLIESLPVEIGGLSGLMLLELSGCEKLKKIPPGIISKLKKLEELIVRGCFDGWEAKNMGRENQNALLSELEHLSSLRRLEIEVKDSRLAAEQLRLSPNLMQYHIIIGDPKSASWEPINSNLHTYERKLELKWLENTSLGDGYGFNFANVEELRLMSSNSFNNLQQLKLVHLPGLEHLNILSNFNMLSSLSVSRCDQLTSLVTRRSSIVQLKSLEIRCCEMMEQVLLWDEEEDQIVFQNLKLLDLSGLPNVTSFSKGIKSIGFPVLEEMTVGGCGLMKSFVCKTSPDDDDHGDWIGILFKSTKSELDSLRKLWVGGYSGSMCRNWCPMITAIFSRLSELHVCEIRNMKSLFPYSVAQYLHNLIELRIQYCNDMVGVIEDDACGGQTPPTPTPLLPNLKQIILHRLPKLKSVCECKHTLEFPSLTRLYIYDCDSMEEFTWGHVSTPILPHIETGYEGGIINISNGVNATLKQEWLERQQEELNSRSKHPVVEIKEFPMMDQNVDSKRVEQSRKRGLSIGLENEFQSQKSRRIEMEEEHREGSSVQEKMKAPIEIMEEDT